MQALPSHSVLQTIRANRTATIFRHLAMLACSKMIRFIIFIWSLQSSMKDQRGILIALGNPFCRQRYWIRRMPKRRNSIHAAHTSTIPRCDIDPYTNTCNITIHDKFLSSSSQNIHPQIHPLKFNHLGDHRYMYPGTSGKIV